MKYDAMTSDQKNEWQLIFEVIVLSVAHIEINILCHFQYQNFSRIEKKTTIGIP